MKKKIIVLLTIVAMCFGFVACGAKDDGIDPNATLTVEQYQKYTTEENRWDMSLEEMEQYFQVKAKVDEEGTKSWGDGYIVADFPGPDEDSYVHFLFKKYDDGKWGVSSVSPVGEFAK